MHGRNRCANFDFIDMEHLDEVVIGSPLVLCVWPRRAARRPGVAHVSSISTFCMDLDMTNSG